MDDLQKLYNQLKEDGALPSDFSGIWEEDREAFMLMNSLNDELDLENILDVGDYFEGDSPLIYD